MLSREWFWGIGCDEALAFFLSVFVIPRPKNEPSVFLWRNEEWERGRDVHADG